MGLFFWLIFPGIVLLVLEGLIAGLPNIDMGRFVIPVLAGAAFLITVIGCTAATGWDSLGWGVLSMSAGTGLLGSLLGLGIGQLFRRLRRRFSHEKTDQTV